MTIHTIGDLLAEFERSTAEMKRREFIAREIYLQNLEDEQRTKIKKHEREEKEQKEAQDALATPKQIEAFTVELDHYDTATVEALMENRHELDRLHTKLDQLYANAYVLPDGRRVFPTANRDAVYDEHGTRLGLDVIDPRAIPAGKSTWNETVETRDAARAAEQKQSVLTTYHAELDAMHERIARGDTSQNDIDRMAAKMRDDAPQAVKDIIARGHDRLAANVAAGPSNAAVASLPVEHRLKRNLTICLRRRLPNS